MSIPSSTTDLDNLRKQLEDSWPSPLVARRDVEVFSGGILKRGTLANHDCRGTGPAERHAFKEGIAYSKASLIDWMLGRLEAPAATRPKSREG